MKRGWVPDQHGAWVMVSVPLVLGIYLGGWHWADIALAIAWFTGYFAYFAATLWCKAAQRRKAQFLRPMLTYGAICAGAAAIVIASAPQVLIAATWFAPLVAIAGFEAWRKRARSLASGISTTLASAGLIPVCALIGATPADPTDWRKVLAFTAIMAVYFSGTIFYVKTLIREKGKRNWLIASIGYHCIATLAAVIAWQFGALQSWLPAAAFAIIAIRAWAMPATAPWTPKQVGKSEAFYTAIVILAMIVGA